MIDSFSGYQAKVLELSDSMSDSKYMKFDINISQTYKP